MRLAALVLLALATLAACERHPTTPEPLAGGYALRSVGGEPLPAVLWSEHGVTLEVVSETLRFHPAGRVARERVLRWTTAATGAAREEGSAQRAEYRFDGERLVVGSFEICDDTAVCLANDVGSVSGGRIVLTGYSFGGARTEGFEYHRE